MKSISLLLSVLLFFMVTACSKKSESEEQTAPFVTAVKPHTKVPDINETAESNDAVDLVRSFVLTNADKKDLNITIEGDSIVFADIDKPLLLMNFFATWCPPCRGELSDLDQLQKKHTKELFIVGILVNDEQNSTMLRHFAEKYHVDYFISSAEDNADLATYVTKRLKLSDNFPIPLSVLYKDGQFYRYYEGAMPIEMMENELKQALKQL